MKCINCGKIDKPTKESICDDCCKEMEKPFSSKAIIVFIIISLFIGYGLYPESVTPLIFGLIAGILTVILFTKKDGNKKRN